MPAGKNQLRIAYVSPMPPQKSGIADYSADLLPYLSKFFEIDLFIEPGLKIIDPYIQKNFRLYPWTELLNRRDQYETVVYQIGNSRYHMDIVNLLKEFPGVVVLHDFYINNIFYTMEVLQGQKLAFLRHMDQSHGLRGMIDLIQYGVDYARQEWPMNWEVVRNAQELIIHSGHQINLFDLFYKSGWKPKPTIIKQLHKENKEIPNSEKDSIRKKLGIEQNVLVFCSFGIIAPTKLNLLTLQAFAESHTSRTRNSLLVFVGELEGGEYGKKILKTIDDFGFE